MKVTRGKIWWIVYIDVVGLPGKLLYREVIKARHPQLAIAEARKHLVAKIGSGEALSFDGPGTSSSLLPGTENQNGYLVGKTWENRDLSRYLSEHQKPDFKPNRTDRKLAHLPLGRVKPDLSIQERFDQGKKG